MSKLTKGDKVTFSGKCSEGVTNHSAHYKIVSVGTKKYSKFVIAKFAGGGDPVILLKDKLKRGWK